ncbi:MAG: hypothetical protein ACLUVV_01035 [Christensenellales bacterium]
MPDDGTGRWPNGTTLCRATGIPGGHDASAAARCRCQAKQPCSLQSARAQLLESIAREEMGIANLLAAEAQRLMRGAHAACASDGVAVGQSVRQTLEAIIDLEHVLLEKLELTLGECMLQA